MTPEQLQEILAEVAAGRLDPERALERLKHLPFERLPFATLDHHRQLRQGHPEVVFCEGKTDEQVAEICARFAASAGSFVGTRLRESQARLLSTRFPRLEWNALGRVAWLPPDPRPTAAGQPVFVISAGTSDLPVSEEAFAVGTAFGLRMERLTDVGVAGIHRILAQTERLHEAGVVIVVAGMEGALPSVVGGLVRCPVIAVPTSVGYGASFGGLAALLGMLNSCAAGVTVVNIDNGFGAAVAASRILRA